MAPLQNPSKIEQRQKPQSNQRNMAEIVFWRWVSEMKCVISQQDSVISWDVYTNYVTKSIFFIIWQKFLENGKN